MPFLSDVLIVDATGGFGWLAGRVLADLGGEVIKLDPPGTDRGRCDWRAFNVNKRVFDPRALRARHPRLVVVAITPFGAVGPRRGWRASDIEVMAAGGAMALTGEPDGVPLRISEPQAYGCAGAAAATGALTALYRRAVTGRGDLVDVSAQAAVV